MRIILARHGESEHNAGLSDDKEGTILTKKGRKQAESLGKKLKKEKISQIYVSKMPRAKETAKIISKIIHISIKGEFEELNEYGSRLLKIKIKNVISWEIEKIEKIIRKYLKNKKDKKTILIIAHGVTNRIIIGHFLQLPLKNIVRFKQHNTGLSVLYWNDDFKNWNLDSMNNTSHLQSKLK